MTSESALALVSPLLMYFFKTAVVYLFLSLVSRSIRNPHVRFWLHGLFLGGAVAGWLYLLLSPSLRVLSSAPNPVASIAPVRHLSLSLDPSLTPALATSLS